MRVPLFPLYGYPLAKMAEICQRLAEKFCPSSRGVLGNTVPLYGYPLAKAAQIASG
jgi:hypothetical protein